MNCIQGKQHEYTKGFANFNECMHCGLLKSTIEPPIETDGGEGMRGWETRFEKYFALDRDCGHADYKCKCRAAVVDSIKHFMADEFPSSSPRCLKGWRKKRLWKPYRMTEKTMENRKR